MVASDTNILVYARRQDSPFHHPFLAMPDHLRNGKLYNLICPIS